MPGTEENGLYNHLCRFDNLLLAWKKAGRGKRSNPAVAAFEFGLEENLLTLQEELEAKTYRPGAYHSFYIHDPKRRLISAAPFRDRVVHHALCNLIEPLFERSFVFDSYANRVGKGNHRALDRAQLFARRHRFVLPLDLQKYFPSIDHAILRRTIARKVKDRDVMWLVGRVLESGRGVLDDEYDMAWFPGDDLLAAGRPRGLPIGNLTSQFWANCYLSGFDHFVKRELRCPGYVRYVDDMLFFADDKKSLWELKGRVIERLAGLRLTAHEGRCQVLPVTEGIPFLGFRLFPHRRRLKARKAVAFARRHRERLRAYAAGAMEFEEVSAGVQGWVAHAAHGDTGGLRRSLLSGTVLTRGEGVRRGSPDADLFQNL